MPVPTPRHSSRATRGGGDATSGHSVRSHMKTGDVRSTRVRTTAHDSNIHFDTGRNRRPQSGANIACCRHSPIRRSRPNRYSPQASIGCVEWTGRVRRRRRVSGPVRGSTYQSRLLQRDQMGPAKKATSQGQRKRVGPDARARARRRKRSHRRVQTARTPWSRLRL